MIKPSCFPDRMRCDVVIERGDELAGRNSAADRTLITGSISQEFDAAWRMGAVGQQQGTCGRPAKRSRSESIGLVQEHVLVGIE